MSQLFSVSWCIALPWPFAVDWQDGEISVSSDLCWQFNFRWCVSFSDISLKTKWYWCFPLIGSWWGDLCEDLQSWWWFQMISSFYRHFCKDQIILVVPDDFFLSGRFVWRLGNTDGSRWCFPFWELSVKSRYYCSIVVPLGRFPWSPGITVL